MSQRILTMINIILLKVWKKNLLNIVYTMLRSKIIIITTNNLCYDSVVMSDEQ